MAHAAIVVLAGTESHADLGRLVNGLQTAREFADAEGDEFELIFDGAGTQWIPELAEEGHDYHDLYVSLQDDVAVCEYCSDAFGVADEVERAESAVVGENAGHPSIRSLVAEDYEIITF